MRQGFEPPAIGEGSDPVKCLWRENGGWSWMRRSIPGDWGAWRTAPSLDLLDVRRKEGV